jgi:hypothetical protein
VEDLLAELLGALLDIFGEFLLQMLFEPVAEALSGLIKSQSESDPAVSAIRLVLVGAAAGLLSAWLFPHRLIVTRVVLPGASLVLAPLASGSAVHFLESGRARVERYPSSLAMFRVGALFAFSMALIRWWLVGLSH